MFNRQPPAPPTTRHNPHSCFTNTQATSPQPLLNKYTPRSPYSHLPKTSSLSQKSPMPLSRSPQSSTNIASKGLIPQQVQNSVEDEYFPNSEGKKWERTGKKGNVERQDRQSKLGRV